MFAVSTAGWRRSLKSMSGCLSRNSRSVQPTRTMTDAATTASQSERYPTPSAPSAIARNSPASAAPKRAAPLYPTADAGDGGGGNYKGRIQQGPQGSPQHRTRMRAHAAVLCDEPGNRVAEPDTGHNRDRKHGHARRARTGINASRATAIQTGVRPSRPPAGHDRLAKPTKPTGSADKTPPSVTMPRLVTSTPRL